MNLPRSCLLDRVKQFLPEMEKANQTLEDSLKTGENTHRIDVTLAPSDMAQSDSDSDDEGVDVDSELRESKRSKRTTEQEGPRASANQEGGRGTAPGNTDSEEINNQKAVVQLEFALGDFDGTPLAQLEDEKDKEDEIVGNADGDDDEDDEYGNA
jgi:hypothetical protein